MCQHQQLYNGGNVHGATATIILHLWRGTTQHNEKRSNKNYFTSVHFDSPYHPPHAIQICVHCQVFFIFGGFSDDKSGEKDAVC